MKHKRDISKASTAEQIRIMLRAGAYRGAILMASKFDDLGEQRGRILSAREAYLRPDFQRAIKRDPEALIADGLAALQERYGI